jgi:predicted Zn-dependent protease
MFSAGRNHLSLSASQEDMARHTLTEVVAYVRYCNEYDDYTMTPRESRTLATLEFTASHPATPQALRVALKTAQGLMKNNDLWLGHNDPERRVILASLSELGYFIADRSIDSDPVPLELQAAF